MTQTPTKPNLFDYATKELSQDAVICWLIAWAGQNKSNDSEKEKLRCCGRKFVHALLNHGREKESVELPEEITTEIHQQDKGIDVLVRINEKQVLLIEDKTGTGDHSGQLKKYYCYVKKGDTKKLTGEALSREDIYPIYFKTGNQSLWDDRRIERLIEGANGYRVFHRKDFLQVLKGYEGKNQILVDFRQYLKGMEEDTNGYTKWIRDSPKSWAAWEGFFRCLEGKLKIKDVEYTPWGYVPNQSGGFMGFWWFPFDSDVYLQIEGEEKLCFKVRAWGKSNEKKQYLKWKWHNKIMQAGNLKKQQVYKPGVMRIGNTMTVGIWKEDWLAFEDGKLDISGTVENLKKAESVLEIAAKSE